MRRTGGRSSYTNRSQHSPTPAGQTYSSNSNNYRGRGSLRGTSSFNKSPRPICQLFNRIGHLAAICYQRYDNMPQPDNQSQMQAYLTSSQNSSYSNWYPDTGATHHLTSELANLNVRAYAYSGPD
jgi:uncharacterized membrane protein YebE (DUF533 family)